MFHIWRHYMDILELLMTTVGPTIAKNILKLWLKDRDIAQDISSDLLDLLKAKVSDIRAQQRGKLQFERIGHEVADNLLPLFDQVSLTDDSKHLIGTEVAKTLESAKI